MEHRNNNGNGSGFLLGVLVGVIITLLFTTKKGREIVKDLTEKGLDKFSTLQDVLEGNFEDEEFDDTNDYVQEEPVKSVSEVPVEPAPQATLPQPPKAEAHKGAVKRFFKLKKN